jgi:hypothetical protein
MIQLKEWFPDDEEREEAGRQIVKDFGNPAYHMYAPMYYLPLWNYIDL